MNGLMDIAYGYDAAGYYYKNFVDIGYEFAHGYWFWIFSRIPTDYEYATGTGYLYRYEYAPGYWLWMILILPSHMFTENCLQICSQIQITDMLTDIDYEYVHGYWFQICSQLSMVLLMHIFRKLFTDIWLKIGKVCSRALYDCHGNGSAVMFVVVVSRIVWWPPPSYGLGMGLR